MLKGIVVSQEDSGNIDPITPEMTKKRCATPEGRDVIDKMDACAFL